MTLWLYNAFLITGNQRYDAGTLYHSPPKTPTPTGKHHCAFLPTLIQHLLLCYCDFIVKTTGFPCITPWMQTVLDSFKSMSDISGCVLLLSLHKNMNVKAQMSDREKGRSLWHLKKALKQTETLAEVISHASHLL